MCSDVAEVQCEAANPIPDGEVVASDEGVKRHSNPSPQLENI